MSRLTPIKITRAALRDLDRLQTFLESKGLELAERAAGEIKSGLKRIAQNPEAHRPVRDMIYHRECIVPFGAAGYIIRFHYKPGEDVLVLRIKHQFEDQVEVGGAETALRPHIANPAGFYPQ